MKLRANNKGGDFEPAPPGNHPAALVGIINLGTQRTEFKGVVDWVPQILLVWELVTEKAADGSNFIIHRHFTASLGRKAKLRGLLEKWRGRAFNEDEDFDFAVVLGKPCLLTVVQGKSTSGNVYAKVEEATAVPKGMSVPPATRKPFVFDDVKSDLATIPDWVPFLIGEDVRDKIKCCAELTGQQPAGTNGANGSQKPPASQADEIAF